MIDILEDRLPSDGIFSSNIYNKNNEMYSIDNWIRK